MIVCVFGHRKCLLSDRQFVYPFFYAGIVSFVFKALLHMTLRDHLFVISWRLFLGSYLIYFGLAFYIHVRYVCRIKACSMKENRYCLDLCLNRNFVRECWLMYLSCDY